MERRTASNGVVYYASPLLEERGVPHGFSTRIGGLSPAPFDSLNLGNVHVVQYLNFYLPLVALLLVRLRDDPVPRRAVPLMLALAAGAFSSYYLALLLALVAAVWTGLPPVATAVSGHYGALRRCRLLGPGGAPERLIP